jgi:hypothetical protein
MIKPSQINHSLNLIKFLYHQIKEMQFVGIWQGTDLREARTNITLGVQFMHPYHAQTLFGFPNLIGGPGFFLQEDMKLLGIYPNLLGK